MRPDMGLSWVSTTCAERDLPRGRPLLPPSVVLHHLPSHRPLCHHFHVRMAAICPGKGIELKETINFPPSSLQNTSLAIQIHHLMIKAARLSLRIIMSPLRQLLPGPLTSKAGPPGKVAFSKCVLLFFFVKN